MFDKIKLELENKDPKLRWFGDNKWPFDSFVCKNIVALVIVAA